jgi:hypothetical protein
MLGRPRFFGFFLSFKVFFALLLEPFGRPRGFVSFFEEKRTMLTLSKFRHDPFMSPRHIHYTKVPAFRVDPVEDRHP